MQRRFQVVFALVAVSFATVLFSSPQTYLAGLTEGTISFTKDECNGNRTSPSIDPTDWFQENLWDDLCLRVDHVCYSTGRWWYGNENQHHFSFTSSRPLHQPNFTLSVVNKKHKSRFPSEISVRPATNLVQNLTCHWSPIPNHLVLYSLYNDMLGEFFIRLLVGLTYILQNQQNDTLEEFLASTQLYLHSFDINKALLESHHAFSAPFLSHQLLNVLELLQSTSCSCVERLILCGYEFNQVEQQGGEGENHEILVEPGPGLAYQSFQTKGAPKHDPAFFRASRNFVRQRVILDNPMVQGDIFEARREFLRLQGVKPDESAEWKIVGLAQRSGRRRWVNIADSVQMCKGFRKEKIICVVVNVEDGYTPIDHVVVHGGLDALIGVHGAQLTDALWMKPGSVVVEFLPYLPSGARYGSWTRTVHFPTPLGLIFRGTDLYHIGVPLDWHSVAKCNALRDQAFTNCALKDRWENRNFNAKSDDVRDIILQFVRNRSPDCEAQQQRAGQDRFVLYNAQCDDGSGKVDTHFFYWDKQIEEYEAYNVVPESLPKATTINSTVLQPDESDRNDTTADLSS